MESSPHLTQLFAKFPLQLHPRSARVHSFRPQGNAASKNKLKAEIDQLDEQYLELLYRIVRQFPHVPKKRSPKTPGDTIAKLFREIADAGGLGIEDPQEWPREIRQDRLLPFREE